MKSRQSFNLVHQFHMNGKLVCLSNSSVAVLSIILCVHVFAAFYSKLVFTYVLSVFAFHLS